MISLSWKDGRLRFAFERLSEEQEQALRCDTEIAVSAGAGAGKTSTLAARFVTLLQRRVESGSADIQDVLVLTFTEKAAQEMRERCYAATTTIARQLRTSADRLRAEGMPAAQLGRSRSAWEGLRDRFAGAAISTFHGFCARVLREFPAETRTPPGFEILEERPAAEHAFCAATEEIDARIAAADPRLELLLRTFHGRAALIEQAASLVRKRGEVAATLADHRDGRVPEADLLARAPISPDAARAFLEGPWADHADQLLSLTTGVTTPYLAAVAALREHVRDPPTDALALHELYADALRVHCTASDASRFRSVLHHSATGAKAAWGPRHAPSRDRLRSLQEELSGWDDRLGTVDLLPNRHDRTLLAVLASLGDVALGAIARHELRLAEARAVDFAGLQLRVRDAFAADPGSGAGSVATQLRARHRYLMVDEFQDTDGLQWAIVRALARPSGQPSDRLFFVGDVKQAIYGFRGGDVEVFNGARRSVGVEVGLSTNYRSRPELITWFNRLFLDVLGPDRPERPAWEAPFAPLSPGPALPGGSVRLATYASEGAEEDAGREAAWIAELLSEEILAGRGAYAGLPTGATPPVAILLRRRRHLRAYEAALRERGIGCVVVGGAGFWSRPEIVDVANVLHALARADLISMVGALRSPLFGLTDQDLLDLKQAGRLRSFGRHAPTAGGDRIAAPRIAAARIAAAGALWAELEGLRDHAALSELVHHLYAITHQSFQQSVSSPDGRGVANLERLLSLADAHEQAGGTLDGFAERVLGHVETDAADAEAVLPATRARVAILTVHASKGLEFPVVIVPDLGARGVLGGNPGVLARRRDDRWELACMVPDRYGRVRAEARPGFMRVLQRHARLVEDAESRRLFYVANTRARDHLVLVGRDLTGSRTPPDQAPSWSDMVRAHLAGAAEAPAWLRIEDVTAWVPGAPAPMAVPRAEAPSPAAEARIAVVRPGSAVDLSPSSLALHVEEPDRWRRRYAFGIEDDARPRRAADGGRAGGGRADGLRAAGIRGQVLHGLLEDEVLDDERVAQARWNAAAREAGLPEAEVSAGWAEVRGQVAVLQASDEVRAVLASRNGYAELGVRWTERGVSLNGRMDRLCRDPADGAWMVVDYKSSRLKRAGDEERHLAQFRTQLLAYSWAATQVLHAQGGEPVVRGAILFTQTGALRRLPDWTAADFASHRANLDAAGAALREALDG